MLLPWALSVLSLLPLLDAQSPDCDKFRAAPLTDATLDRISGKWFYIASASRDPEYHETAKKLQAAYFHLTPNKREDTIQLREYSTIDNQCYYDFSILNVQRDKGTLSKQGEGSPRAQSGCVEWGGCGRVSRQEGMRPKPLGLWTQRI
nr:PREDICTED: alpha-1-acid glycoprotein 2-like isoform X4 [Equus przewalskii]